MHGTDLSVFIHGDYHVTLADSLLFITCVKQQVVSTKTDYRYREMKTPSLVLAGVVSTSGTGRVARISTRAAWSGTVVPNCL